MQSFYDGCTIVVPYNQVFVSKENSNEKLVVMIIIEFLVIA